MSYADWIGTIGVGLILVAFFCQTFGLLSPRGTLFYLLNLVGAGLACYASLLIPFWPFVVLEGTWCLVSVVGLVKRNNPHPH